MWYVKTVLKKVILINLIYMYTSSDGSETQANQYHLAQRKYDYCKYWFYLLLIDFNLELLEPLLVL